MKTNDVLLYCSFRRTWIDGLRYFVYNILITGREIVLIFMDALRCLATYFIMKYFVSVSRIE
ncbi:MAG: hypothetical protein ACK53Y_16790, partial [bacterium]